jgi:hypothetical protein
MQSIEGRGSWEQSVNAWCIYFSIFSIYFSIFSIDSEYIYSCFLLIQKGGCNFCCAMDMVIFECRQKFSLI